MNKITITQVIEYAAVVNSVLKHERVAGEVNDNVIDGTLRAITPGEGSPNHLHQGDLRTAWVWITTVRGFETWVQFVDLVAAHNGGDVALNYTR